MLNNARFKKVIPYVVVLIGTGYLFYVATRFEFVARAGSLGPDFWPKLLLVLMMAACAYEIVKTLVFGAGEVEGVLEAIIEEAGAEQAVEPEEKTYLHLLLIGIALTLAYVYLFDVLGFFIDTFLYLALFMVVGRYRRPGVILTASLIGSLTFMFVFMKIVYVSLPIGREPFSAVSLLLMKLMGIR